MSREKRAPSPGALSSEHALAFVVVYASLVGALAGAGAFLVGLFLARPEVTGAGVVLVSTTLLAAAHASHGYAQSRGVAKSASTVHHQARTV